MHAHHTMVYYSITIRRWDIILPSHIRFSSVNDATQCSTYLQLENTVESSGPTGNFVAPQVIKYR